MAIGSMMGFADDAGALLMRILGRGRTTSAEGALPYVNPEQMVSALRNPATEARAVERMRKMHYGAFYGKNSRGAFSGLAERELLKKGAGFGGLAFGRPMKGLSVGFSHLKGNIAFAPLAAIAGAAFAPKGHKMSGAVGGVARAAAFALGDVVGTTIGGPVLGFVVGSLTEPLGGYVGDALQMFSDYNKQIKHINMGGNYEDTRVAYTMRQRAAQEMGTSVMNARQWLGKEAALMHQ